MSKIIFMGDSITEYMPYIFKGTIGNADDEVIYRGMENIGVGNYIKYIWPRVDRENVDTYILLIGINNIFRPDCDEDGRESLDEIICKIKEFIDLIINAVNSRLIVQSLYPTKYLSLVNNVKVVNEQIKLYCEEKGIEFLDIYSILKDENESFDNQYTKDGIHPNAEGYNIIAKEINKRLKVKQGMKLNRKKN